MGHREFTFSFSSDSAGSDGLFLIAKQEDFPKQSKVANISDVMSMLGLAGAYQSAHLFSKFEVPKITIPTELKIPEIGLPTELEVPELGLETEVDFDALNPLSEKDVTVIPDDTVVVGTGSTDSVIPVYVNVRVFVYHSPNLAYTRATTYGKFKPMQVQTDTREESFVIDFGRELELDWVPVSSTFEWETPTYDAKGSIVPNPEITCASGSNIVRFSTNVFGVLRVTSVAEVDVHTLVIQNRGGYKVKNFNATVSFTYTDSVGKEVVKELAIEVPSYVEDTLSTCPEEEKELIVLFNAGSGERAEKAIEIKYFVCTGEVYKIIEHE